MPDAATSLADIVDRPTKQKRKKPLQVLWRKLRGPLADSRFVKSALSSAIAAGLRIVAGTNRIVTEPVALFGPHGEHEPGIVAFWHGQHLLSPALNPTRRGVVAMVSRSADAELNAQVLERFGVKTVRGSGGRARRHDLDKGGARALLALKKALAAGNNVCMIADIPNGVPREAGAGIILLARISGRPIAPCAIATSRRLVLEKTWDRTTVNLPFGRCAIVAGAPIHVPADADDAGLEAKRLELTAALNAATRQAQDLADARP